MTVVISNISPAVAGSDAQTESRSGGSALMRREHPETVAPEATTSATVAENQSGHDTDTLDLARGHQIDASTRQAGRTADGALRVRTPDDASDLAALLQRQLADSPDQALAAQAGRTPANLVALLTEN